MKLDRGYVGAVRATVRRDIAVFMSYRLRMAGQMVTMLFTMTMFYYVSKLVRPGVVGPGAAYFAYVVVGIISFAILTAAVNVAQLVRMELFAGTFERMIISPVGPVGGVVSLIVFPITYAIAIAGVMLTLAAEVFGFPVRLTGIPPALGVAALAALAFACIGLLFVAALLAFKSSVGVTWVLAAFSLLGGVYFPLSLFPSWLRVLSEIQPFTPTVDLLRHLLLGIPASRSIGVDVVKLGAFTAVLMPLAFAALWAGVDYSRGRGTLMEY